MPPGCSSRHPQGHRAILRLSSPCSPPRARRARLRTPPDTPPPAVLWGPRRAASPSSSASIVSRLAPWRGPWPRVPPGCPPGAHGSAPPDASPPVVLWGRRRASSPSFSPSIVSRFFHLVGTRLLPSWGRVLLLWHISSAHPPSGGCTLAQGMQCMHRRFHFLRSLRCISCMLLGSGSCKEN